MEYTRKKFIRTVSATTFGIGILRPLSTLADINRRYFQDYVESSVSLMDQQEAGTLTDPNICYIGRWDKSDPQLYHSYWGGAYLKTIFTGKTVSIRLAADTNLVVSIDNEVPREISGKVGITDLTVKPLKEGTHSLLAGSAGQNFEVLFQGLVLDVNSSTSSPKQFPIIEFIGDSITTGTGPGKISTVNYAWNTAVALGCDHVQIAFSGIALTTGFGCLRDKIGMDKQYFRLKNFNHLKDEPQADWDFGYTPAIIVINLGQNDQCGKEPPETFTESLTGFVRKLRFHFPVVKIAILRPFGGPYAEAIISAVNNLNQSGDKRVAFIDTTGWLDKDDYSDGVHPNGTGNLKVTGHLIPLLRPLLNN